MRNDSSQTKSDPTLTPTAVDGVYKDVRGNRWLWTEVGGPQFGIPIGKLRYWRMQKFCKPLGREMKSAKVATGSSPPHHRVVILESEYRQAKAKIATALQEGKLRETAAAASKRRPSVAEDYLRDYADEICPLLSNRKLTAPYVLCTGADGRPCWGQGFLPKDVDTIADAIEAAHAKSAEEKPDRLTLGQAFEKYGHWVKDRRGRKTPSRKIKHRSFASLLKSWRKFCRWLDGPLDDGSFVRARKIGGAMKFHTWDAETLATIDRRIKAQGEGVWYRTKGGEWFSAEQVRNGEHGDRELRRCVTAYAAARLHRVGVQKVKGWGDFCIYIGEAIDHWPLKTYAAVPDGSGLETVYDANQIADAATKSRGVHPTTLSYRDPATRILAKRPRVVVAAPTNGHPAPGAATQQAAPPEQPAAKSTTNADDRDPIFEACHLKKQNPDWSDRQVAKAAGLKSHSKLSRSEIYQRVKAVIDGDESALRRGWRKDSGDVETATHDEPPE